MTFTLLCIHVSNDTKITKHTNKLYLIDYKHTSFFRLYDLPVPPSITPTVHEDDLDFSSIVAQGTPPLPYVPGPGRLAWNYTR